jgi:type IV pilus assembly protein PilB
MMARDRMVVGKPPRTPGTGTPPGRVPLTKEQIGIGRILLAEGPITSDMVRRQIEEAGLQNSLLAKAVAASGHAPESELIILLLTGYRIPKVKLANYRVPEEALRLIPGSVARKHNVVPLGKIGSIVCVAVGSIFGMDVRVVEEIRRETGCMVKVFQSTSQDVEAAVKRFYPAPKRRELAPAIQVTPDVVESLSSESVPYEDTAEYWEEVYASAGPLKAVNTED